MYLEIQRKKNRNRCLITFMSWIFKLGRSAEKVFLKRISSVLIKHSIMSKAILLIICLRVCTLFKNFLKCSFENQTTK